MQFLHIAEDVRTILGLTSQNLHEVLLKQFLQSGMVTKQGWHAPEVTAKESFTQSVQTDMLEHVRQLIKVFKQRSQV